MDGSFVPFCFKYTDFRNLCNEKYKRKTIEGVEEGRILRHALECMTAPFAKGAFFGGRLWTRDFVPAARPKDGARLAALHSPFGNLRPLRGAIV